MDLPRFRPRTLMVAVAISGAMFRLAPILWNIVSLGFIDDAYAQWGAGDMVVHFMEDHDGRWPRGWEELRPYFDAGGGGVGGWSFEKYQRRVRIDWRAGVEGLAAQSRSSPRATFREIWAASGLSSAMQDPNEIVHSYLQSRPDPPEPE